MAALLNWLCPMKKFIKTIASRSNRHLCSKSSSISPACTGTAVVQAALQPAQQLSTWQKSVWRAVGCESMGYFPSALCSSSPMLRSCCAWIQALFSKGQPVRSLEHAAHVSLPSSRLGLPSCWDLLSFNDTLLDADARVSCPRLLPHKYHVS